MINQVVLIIKTQKIFFLSFSTLYESFCTIFGVDEIFKLNELEKYMCAVTEKVT